MHIYKRLRCVGFISIGIRLSFDVRAGVCVWDSGFSACWLLTLGVYYILYYYILLYIYYYILYYTLLFCSSFPLSSYSSLLFFLSSPFLSSSSHPTLLSPIPSSHSLNTCRHLLMFIYIAITSPGYSDPACFIGVDGWGV